MKHNYGLTHALATAGLTVAGFVAGGFVPAVALCVVSTAYWYSRERKARTKDGTPAFKDWYPDSQFDVISAALAGAGTLFILHTYF